MNTDSAQRGIPLILAFTGMLTPLTMGQYCAINLAPEEIAEVHNRMTLGLYENPHALTINNPTIPIKWHVVTASDGTRCISNLELDQYLLGINEAFEDARVSFCTYENTHLIVDDALFANVESYYGLRMIEPSTNAIDIYWCPNLIDGQLCGTSSYTFSPIQGIVMQSTCMGNSDVLGVLIHELGHYFDLFHTHEMGFGIECPVGGDCTTQGDLICDTVPCRSVNFDECVDPTTCESRSNRSCYESYPPPVCDGSLYPPPDTRNYMAYSPVQCLTEFTPMQLVRISATYLNFRQELHGGDCNITSECVADINRDGIINGVDMALLLQAWGSSSNAADLNNDGIVNGLDLSIMLSLWSNCAE